MTYAELKQQVDLFYSDTSRTPEETKDALEELQGEIEIMLEALEYGTE